MYIETNIANVKCYDRYSTEIEKSYVFKIMQGENYFVIPKGNYSGSLKICNSAIYFVLNIQEDESFYGEEVFLTNYGSNFKIETIPDKMGYTFNGWVDENGAQITNNSGQSLLPAESLFLNLYATWTAKMVKMCFSNETDSLYWTGNGFSDNIGEGVELIYNTIDLLDIMEDLKAQPFGNKEGHYLSSIKCVKINASPIIMYFDLIWAEEEYELIFLKNENTYMDKVNLKYSETADFNLNNYITDGTVHMFWSQSNGKGINYNSLFQGVVVDLTPGFSSDAIQQILMRAYEATPMYLMTYQYINGEIKQVKVSDNTVIVMPTSTKIKGYNTYWYFEEFGSSMKLKEGFEYGKTVKSMIFVEKVEAIIYNIIFGDDDLGGDYINNNGQNYSVENKLCLKKVTYNGYKFEYWKEISGEIFYADVIYDVTRDITIVPIWSKYLTYTNQNIHNINGYDKFIIDYTFNSNYNAITFVVFEGVDSVEFIGNYYRSGIKIQSRSRDVELIFNSNDFMQNLFCVINANDCLGRTILNVKGTTTITSINSVFSGDGATIEAKNLEIIGPGTLNVTGGAGLVFNEENGNSGAGSNGIKCSNLIATISFLNVTGGTGLQAFANRAEGSNGGIGGRGGHGIIANSLLINSEGTITGGQGGNGGNGIVGIIGRKGNKGRNSDSSFYASRGENGGSGGLGGDGGRGGNGGNAIVSTSTSLTSKLTLVAGIGGNGGNAGDGGNGGNGGAGGDDKDISEEELDCHCGGDGGRGGDSGRLGKAGFDGLKIAITANLCSEKTSASNGVRGNGGDGGIAGSFGADGVFAPPNKCLKGGHRKGVNGAGGSATQAIA